MDLSLFFDAVIPRAAVSSVSRRSRIDEHQSIETKTEIKDIIGLVGSAHIHQSDDIFLVADTIKGVPRILSIVQYQHSR